MLKDFKPVLGILLRFVGIYLVMLFAYQFYLNHFAVQGLDPYSRMIAEQVRVVQNRAGYATQLYNDVPGEQVWFYVKKEYVTRMVEGCNAISVIILFLAFIFAFYKGAVTFLFAGLSFIALYAMNLIRIVGLNIVTRDYPEYSKMTHDYFFPAVIYGSVVLLWLIWIKYFALKK